MRIAYAAVLIFFGVALAIFCVQNLQTISLVFLGWKLSLPLPLLLLGLYVLGMVSGWSLFSFLKRSLRRATEHQE